MSSAALAVAVAAAAVAVVLVAILLTVRAARARRRAVSAELAQARAEVEALSSRVAELATELGETRRTAAADHEYVITSFAGSDAQELGHPDPSGLVRTRRRMLE